MTHLQVRHDLSLKTRLQRSQLHHAAMADDLTETMRYLSELEYIVEQNKAIINNHVERIAKLVAANEKAHTEHTTLIQLKDELQKKLKWTEEKLADLQTSYNELKALKGVEVVQNNSD